MTLAMVDHPKMEHLRYRCLWILARGERTLKCGRCSTGTMIPKLGDKCRVCGSKVVEMRESQEGRSDAKR